MYWSSFSYMMSSTQLYLFCCVNGTGSGPTPLHIVFCVTLFFSCSSSSWNQPSFFFSLHRPNKRKPSLFLLSYVQRIPKVFPPVRSRWGCSCVKLNYGYVSAPARMCAALYFRCVTEKVCLFFPAALHHLLCAVLLVVEPSLTAPANDNVNATVSVQQNGTQANCLSCKCHYYCSNRRSLHHSHHVCAFPSSLGSVTH